MNTTNNDDHPIINGNAARTLFISTPPNVSSNILNAISPRRSARLSSKSPQVSPRAPSQSNIHRTMSGGVTNSHSPKLNIRKRGSFSGGRGGYASSQSQIVLDNNVNLPRGKNSTTMRDIHLPSDQSDDEETTSAKTGAEPKVKGRVPRSEVLSYFEQETNGFKCKICHKVYRASKLSDTNLRKHLSSSTHMIPNVLFKSQINDNSNTHTKPVSTERRQELHSAAIDCIIQDGLPFNTFRRPGMSHFLSMAIPGYKGPHRKTVRRRVGILYSIYTEKLRMLIPKLGFIALTSDLWENSRRVHFISLTAHILTKTFDYVSIVIGCRRIIGQHLAASIERYIKYELNRLGIQKEQIVSITTDNGSNMKLATSSFKFGDRISCMAHNLNLVIKKGLCLWIEPKSDDISFQRSFDLDEWEDLDDDVDDVSEDIDDADNVASDLHDDEDEDDSSTNEDGDDEDEDDSSTNEDGDDVIQAVNNQSDSDSDLDVQFCSLTVNDNYSTPIDHFQLLTHIFELMKKTRGVIKFMLNHTVTNEYINKCMISKCNTKRYGSLVLDMLIRWNSSFLLLDRLLLHKDILNSMFNFPNNLPGLTEKQKKRLKELALNQNEWELLAVLKKILEPFLHATTALSGQTYPTMALAFYIHRLLSFFLESTASDDPVTAALKQSLRFWFTVYCVGKLPTSQMETMLVAAFLDPSIYNLLNDNDRKSAKKVIFRRLNNASDDSPTVPSPIPRPSATATATTQTKLTPLEKLAMVCGRILPTSTTNKPIMTLDEEISMYIKSAKSANDFQEFWNEHGSQLPRLSKLVRRVNIIPATSVSSEALFSVAGFLQRKQRSSLSSRTLRYLLVLKNHHLLDELVRKYL